MAEDKGPKGSGADSAPATDQLATPTISLPKGGGANPVTGSGSLTIPIATSLGRSGFGPQLSLSYDSGTGNGPFGLGRTLSVPAIARKIDKVLPQYHDAEESDVFILSDAEDLVPVLVEQNGKWVPETLPDRAIGTAAPGARTFWHGAEREGSWCILWDYRRGADWMQDVSDTEYSQAFF